MTTTTRRSCCLAAGAVLGLTLSASPARADATSDELKTLRQQIEALAQKVQLLEQKHASDQETLSQLKIVQQAAVRQQEAVAATARIAPVVSVGANGLQVRSADSNFIFGVRGYIQADGRFGVASSAATFNDTFLLRRVRPIFEGTLYKIVDYRLMLEFGSGTVASTLNTSYVLDAYANLRFLPQLQLQVGKMKVPTGLERSQSTANLLFIETGFATMLTPNYCVGAMLQGEVLDRKLSYQAGVFNSVPDGGSADFQAYDQGNLAGRLFATPLKDCGVPALEGVGLGVGGSYGSLAGSSLANYNSMGQQSQFPYLANVAADGTQWRLAPQGYYYWGPFGLYGEYVVASQDVRRTGLATSQTGTLVNRAWQVAASCFVTGERNAWRPVAVGNPVTFTKDSGWGAVELAARIQGIHFDTANFPTFAAAHSAPTGAFAWGVGANWFWNRNLKLSLNYENTDFHGGGQNPITAQNEQVVLTQLQLSF